MFVFLYKDFKAIFEIFNGSHEQKSNLKETECGPLSWHYILFSVQVHAAEYAGNLIYIFYHKSLSHLPTQYIYFASESALETFLNKIPSKSLKDEFKHAKYLCITGLRWCSLVPVRLMVVLTLPVIIYLYTVLARTLVLFYCPSYSSYYVRRWLWIVM